MPEDKPAGKPLSREQLGSDQATAALGVIATQHLALHGMVCLYTTADGIIQVAPPGEVTLDAVPEPMAIQELVDRGYTEDEMIEYLKGRDARSHGDSEKPARGLL